MFLSVCCINFRDILVTNGNRGWMLRDKMSGKSVQFYNCGVWEERLNMKQDSMGSNPQPPANEVGVKTILSSYFLNNITMGPEHVDTRSIQVWRKPNKCFVPSNYAAEITGTRDLLYWGGRKKNFNLFIHFRKLSDSNRYEENSRRSITREDIDCLPSPNICKQLLVLTFVGRESECFPKLAYRFFLKWK